jgi:tRNA nucleotidyltransferase (CCA-adding enzyme)
VTRGAPGRVLEALPAAARALVDRVLAEAEARGAAVHLVGGPVRDFLLGRALRDVDLLVEAWGGAAELARAAAPAGARVVAHERFATAKLEAGEASVDLASARSERYARPGVLPEVAPGTLEQDLARRDFSANALALPLSSAARRGRPAVIEVPGGLADLDAGLLRVLHPRSFHDDPTRALRAARLGPRLGFRLARGSAGALRAALRDGAFGGVSGERLRAELEKLFADASLGLDPARARRALDAWHVLAALEPGLALPAPAATPLRRLGRAVAAPPFAPGALRPALAGLMLWLAPLDAGLRRRVLRRLAVEGAGARAVGAFPAQHQALLRRLAHARGRGACDALLAAVEPEPLLAHWALAPAPARRRIERWAREDRACAPPLDGRDLVALGLSGPAVGAALARVRAAWLDREVRTRDDALALARELAGAAGTARGPGAPVRRGSARRR